MSGLALLAADLDRTLIYSRAALALAQEPQPRLRCVELVGANRLSFMTETAATLLAGLVGPAGSAVLVPVTTRSLAQLARVRLPVRTRYAIAANGGYLCVDGVIEPSWSIRVRQAVREVASLDEVYQYLSRACRPEWTVKLRQVESLFCYAVIERDRLPDGFVDEATGWAAGRGWAVSLQGRKLYWVPLPLTKSAAVAEVARRLDANVTLAAGDSLLDIDLLEAADKAIHPGHGELAESGWSAPRVCRTDSVGVRAGEDICRWFHEQVAAWLAGIQPDAGIQPGRPGIQPGFQADGGPPPAVAGERPLRWTLTQ
ncbi:MAG: HAD family hydrolase [Jatrophihabitans sp.]